MRRPFDTDSAPSSCEHCGAPLIPGNVFCTSCGTRVAQVEEAPRTEGDDVFCTNCGAKIVPGNNFCTNCRQEILWEAGGANVPGPTPDPSIDDLDEPVDPPPIPTSLPIPPEDEYVIVGYCTACGKPLYEGNNFCTFCAAPVVPLPPEDSPVNDTTDEDDDDPTMLSKLLSITQEEARVGCRKTLVLDGGQTVVVEVPAGANPGTKIDIPGYGLVNKRTGSRGVLRVSCYIAR